MIINMDARVASGDYAKSNHTAVGHFTMGDLPISGPDMNDTATKHPNLFCSVPLGACLRVFLAGPSGPTVNSTFLSLTWPRQGMNPLDTRPRPINGAAPDQMNAAK